MTEMWPGWPSPFLLDYKVSLTCEGKKHHSMYDFGGTDKDHPSKKVASQCYSLTQFDV
jgi:hypothetical protein